MTMEKKHLSFRNESISLKRCEALLNLMQTKKVLVVGDAGVDRYTLGTVDRISPEAPVPVVRVREEKIKLGLAANVAENVQAMGGEALLTTVIGEDRFGEDFLSLLQEKNLSQKGVCIFDSHQTVLKARVLGDGQQVVRVDYEAPCALSEKEENIFLEKLFFWISQVDIVILEDYNKGVLKYSLLKKIFQKAKEEGKKILLDPASSYIEKPFYKGAFLMTPNRKETEYLSAIELKDDFSIQKAGEILLEKFELQALVMTLGAEGMILFERGVGVPVWIKTFAKEVYDVSGAGDTVVATLALAMSAGATLLESCVLANAAAGVVVGKKGTATVSQKELVSVFKEQNFKMDTTNTLIDSQNG